MISCFNVACKCRSSEVICTSIECVFTFLTFTPFTIVKKTLNFNQMITTDTMTTTGFENSCMFYHR